MPKRLKRWLWPEFGLLVGGNDLEGLEMRFYGLYSRALDAGLGFVRYVKVRESVWGD